MVNHLQTLLLNESAAAVQSAVSQSEYGYVDPSFRSVAPDDFIGPVYADLFAGADDIPGKLKIVKLMEPYLRMPESKAFYDFFDPRTTQTDSVPSSVFGFYAAMATASDPALDAPKVLASGHANQAFGLTGNGLVDEFIRKARDIYENTVETSRRFSMLLYAVALHLHAAYMRSAA